MHRLVYMLLLLACVALGWSLAPQPPEAARMGREPVLPSTVTHELVIQRRVLVGLGVQCREDAERNLTLCQCRD